MTKSEANRKRKILARLKSKGLEILDEKEFLAAEKDNIVAIKKPDLTGRKYILSFSGGKDSTAALIYLIKERRLPLFVVFCDTFNESPETYRYVDYISGLLEEWGYPPVIKLAGQYSFYDLAKKKQRFPSIKARFCTGMLKIVPKIRWIQEQNFETDPVITLGIRRDESVNRSKRHEWEFSCQVYDELLWNPLVDWNVKQVFAIHKKYGVEPNPMYKKGFKRVGCFPCVNCGRNELILMAKHYPERIEEIDRWEKELDSTYLAPRKKGVICKIHTQIRWAKKDGKDSKQGLLFPDASLCSYAGLGVCE
ncbi:MAG: phosphoadenosine phosphosulfate reductase family protein [bacterium]